MKTGLAFAALLFLATPAHATPLLVTIPSGGTLPPLDPCYINCHWEQVIDTTPDPVQTEAERLADLAHEPAWVDFVLWCPPVTPPSVPPSRPPTTPPGSPPTVPPSEPPLPPGPPTTPPVDVAEPSVIALLLAGLVALKVRR